MPETGPLAPLLAALGSLVDWLHAAHVSGVVIGGVAASLLGRPRTTRDVDALVILEESRWADFLSLGEQFGFKPRRPDALAFAQKARVLLVRHEPSAIDADIIFGALSFEKEAVAGAIWVEIQKLRIPLATPEDLIIMKAVANRPRDLADIESLLDAHPKIDLERVRRWVDEFSKALEMSGILSDLENILSKHRKKKK